MYAIIIGVVGLFCFTILLIQDHPFLSYGAKDHMIVSSMFLMIFGIIFCFIASSYYLFKLSRNLQNSEKVKFEAEKEKFLSMLAVFFLIAVTWVVEQLEWFSAVYANNSSIDAGFVKLFTSINIFVIFGMREKVKVLMSKNYRIFQRSVSTQST